jgi:integrase
MSVYKPDKSPFYAYDFRRGGKRHTGSTGKTERREAEAELKRLIRLAEASCGPDGRTTRTQRRDQLTVGSAVDRYWEEVCQYGASPDADLKLLDRLATLLGHGTLLAAVSDDVVSRAVAERRKQYRMDNPALGPVSAATVNRTVTELLRRVFTRARKVWRIQLPLEPNWGAHLLAEPKERVRELRYDEEDRLEDVEREDYRPPRLFAQMTGLRRREVVSLSWPQVDFHTGAIRVVGKGDKPHVVPITPELEDLLREQIGNHPVKVFTYLCQRTRVCARSKRKLVKGERYPITEQGLATHMRRAIAKAGIADLRPMHDFRHTAATRTLRATGNLRLVQNLLGHASPATTAKYAHATLDDVREGMVKAAADSSTRRSKSRTISRRPREKVERAIGIEPTTFSLGS